MFSPFDFYQFFYNTSDQMVETYLKLFTFYDLNEIETIMNKHRVSRIYDKQMQSFILNTYLNLGQTRDIYRTKGISKFTLHFGPWRSVD